MKTFNHPIYFNRGINQQATHVPAVLSLLLLSIFMLALLIPTAYAEEPYRFNRLWPKLEQPWSFSVPSDVAISPDWSRWLGLCGGYLQ